MFQFLLFYHFGASSSLVGPIILCLSTLKYILAALQCSKEKIYSFPGCTTKLYPSCNLILCCHGTLQQVYYQLICHKETLLREINYYFGGVIFLKKLINRLSKFLIFLIKMSLWVSTSVFT